MLAHIGFGVRKCELRLVRVAAFQDSAAEQRQVLHMDAISAQQGKIGLDAARRARAVLCNTFKCENPKVHVVSEAGEDVSHSWILSGRPSVRAAGHYSQALHQHFPQAQLGAVGFVAGQARVDELSPEELIRCQTAQQLKLFRGEFQSDACQRDSSGTKIQPRRRAWAKPGHFALSRCISIVGMVSCEAFFQLSQASAEQITLHAIANETERYPMGREMINTAGLKIKATINKATVAVYPVPVGFCCESNMTISSVTP
jgi:hypothetical protein